VAFFGPSLTCLSGGPAKGVVELIACDELAVGDRGTDDGTAKEEAGEIADRVPAAEPLIATLPRPMLGD
jgi:hypothetical protein